MPANFLPSAAEYLRILPELILILAGVLVMLLEGMRDENEPSTVIPGAHADFDHCRDRGFVYCLRKSRHSVSTDAHRRRLRHVFSCAGACRGFAGFLSFGTISWPRARRYQRVLGTALVFAFRAVPDGGGERTDHDLHRSRDFLDCDVHHVRVSSG